LRWVMVTPMQLWLSFGRRMAYRKTLLPLVIILT